MLQNNQKIIHHKVGLLNLAKELGNLSKACQIMGLSRGTFYRYRDAVEVAADWREDRTHRFWYYRRLREFISKTGKTHQG